MRVIDRLVPWLIGAFVMTVALAAVYGGLQQLNRLGADDAGQRLTAEIGAASTASGSTSPRAAQIDLATSLQPFYVVYDASGRPISGDGYLNGRLAQVPRGVVATAIATGTDRVSWEPQPGLRFATVAKKFGNRVVLAGESLQPTESRIDKLGILMAAGWAAAMLALAVGAALHLWLGHRFGPGRA